MNGEIVFIFEPDAGRVTVESSRAKASVAKEIERDLGQGTALNCARPLLGKEKSAADNLTESGCETDSERIHLFRLYHNSTVDGFGRRSVVQVAGCSILCAGCYIPETHLRANGRSVSIDEIVREIDEQRATHDGVTILGGEPFDQIASLMILVEKLKVKNYHVTIYTGYTLETLLEWKQEEVNRILGKTDLLIDGAFDRNLTKDAGEYRGSSNQRLIFYPILKRKTMSEQLNLPANDEQEKRKQAEAKFSEFIETCLDEGWSPTKCPKGCVVETDSVCPHDFKSIALELGFI